MPTTMRLLLLLSALLTAMVGVGAPAAAAPHAACAVSATASVRTERAVPQIAAFAERTPVALDRVNFARIALSAAPARLVPLYAERLRV